MCTSTTGTDCSAAGFQSLATQSGSFGCAIVSEWTPVITPPQWDVITNGVQLTVQNGDACPDGTNRGVQVKFTCGYLVGPATFFAAEPVTCQYEWDFPSTAACGPGQHPSGPASAAALAARNFGCGHISCGWMFLIIIPLVSILAFAIMVPVNKFVLKKGGTWKDAIPLTVLPCLLFDFVKWGILFAIFNWPCCAQKWEFKRFNCAKAGGGFSSSDHGDADDGASGYQAGDDIDSAIEHDDI